MSLKSTFQSVNEDEAFKPFTLAEILIAALFIAIFPVLMAVTGALSGDNPTPLSISISVGVAVIVSVAYMITVLYQEIMTRFDKLEASRKSG